MKRFKTCEYCGKNFVAKSSLARYCSHNCRIKGYYHQKNPDAKKYILGKSDEEKQQQYNEYFRKYYKDNIKYREEQKARRRQYYKINHK